MALIGLDIGTTGCKAIVFEPSGKQLGHAFREYDVVCKEPGMAEQDAERVWLLSLEVLGQAVEKSPASGVSALSVSVQGDAIIPTTKDFKALYPAVLGMDYRSEPQARWCDEHLGGFELFQRTGMRPHAMNSIVKALWLREQRPEVFKRAERIVTYADFILGKLGADYAAIDHTMASRTMAFDLESKSWSEPFLERVGIGPEMLSKPVPSGAPVGNLSAAVAKRIGLSGQTLLVAGGHDQACAALGSGVVREGIGLLSTGTAEVLSTAFSKPPLTREMFDSFYPCYLHAKAGMYFTFALNHVGGILLKWYRDTLAAADVSTAKAQNRDPYEVIDSQMPEGPSPLMVVPHWHGSGTPTCDMRAKGAVLGWTMATTRHDLSKAILEGLTFELLINLKTMLRSGVEVRELVAAGGGAKSTRWLQLKADILNRPIRIMRCREAACLGAALLAGSAAGDYQSLEEAVQATVAPEKEFLPNPSRAGQYSRRFATYEKLYPALKPIQLDL